MAGGVQVGNAVTGSPGEGSAYTTQGDRLSPINRRSNGCSMTRSVAFRARARTIDHLGRGQIADAPTAISELWKNAYDAYARNVALHIFDGGQAVGAIFDDGVGMSRDDVLDRWLVIGTESKIEDFDGEPADTFGLPVRTRQGEKGIGRLSVAFLAPGTVLVSKRADSKFVAVVVDWRLFENPFLALDDIRLPVEQFASPEELIRGLPALVDTLAGNFGGNTTDRGKRLVWLEAIFRVRSQPWTPADSGFHKDFVEGDASHEASF